jgi:hypothetical protein
VDLSSPRNESPIRLQSQAEEAAGGGPDGLGVSCVEGGALDTMARYVRRCLGTMKPPGVSGGGIALPVALAGRSPPLLRYI